MTAQERTDQAVPLRMTVSNEQDGEFIDALARWEPFGDRKVSAVCEWLLPDGQVYALKFEAVVGEIVRRFPSEDDQKFADAFREALVEAS